MACCGDLAPDLQRGMEQPCEKGMVRGPMRRKPRTARRAVRACCCEEIFNQEKMKRQDVLSRCVHYRLILHARVQ